MTIKNTKIVATIGPASGSLEMLTKLAAAGLNVARLNFSHGTHEDHAQYIHNIRAAGRALGRPLAVLQDLQGPKIRVADIPATGRDLKDGEEVIFTTARGAADKIAIDNPRVHQDVRAGEHLLLDDGLMEVEIRVVRGQDLVCRVIHGGQLLPHKGVNFPHSQLNISALTDKDRTDLRFGVAQGVDWVALSFVRSADDVREARQLIHAYEEELGLPHDPPIGLIAKIEKREAMECLDEIVDVVDAVIVARGDLGIEMPFEQVPIMQKRIIDTCLRAAKPVIVATQMLDSMIRNPRPTRAEVSDIANAVMDHVDATMLSGETTTGKYPLESLQAMAATIQATEASVYDDSAPWVGEDERWHGAVTKIRSQLQSAPDIKAVLVATTSITAVHIVSRERPAVPIVFMAAHERIRQQADLSWGLHVLPVCEGSSCSSLIVAAANTCMSKGMWHVQDRILIVTSENLDEPGALRLAEVRTLI